MDNRIKLADPFISEQEKEAVLRVLQSGQLVNGPRAREFEERLAAQTGRSHAVVVSSGTTALLAALVAMDIGPGSTVVVPGFTFPAPASVAAFLGATVRVCDVDPHTFCLTAETVRPHLDESVSLVVAIDQFGLPAPVPDLIDLLRPHKIPILVDAACSLGASLNGVSCGALGDVATLSFHPRKIVTTGEGGVVLTDRPDIALRVRLLSNHGIDPGAGGFADIGLNLRMSEIAAAIGLCQLDRLDGIVARRREIAEMYRELPLEFQKAGEGAFHNHQTIAAMLPRPFKKQDRDNLIKSLKDSGIEVTIASYCLGGDPVLARRFGIAVDTPEVASDLANRGVALPVFPGLRDEQVREVIRAVQTWLQDQRAVG